MITKSIIKDYVVRKCPYLAKASLDDNSLLRLVESFLEFGSTEDIEEKVLEGDDGGDDGENPNENMTFDVLEIMRDYPYLKHDIEELIIKHQQENPIYDLKKKYDDTQVTSRLSRRYIEMIYGKDNCKRCDVNDFDVEVTNQAYIVNKTKEYLKDPNVKVLFEGQIEHEDLRARFDILIKEDDGSLTLVEAKGSNSPFKKSSNGFSSSIKEGYMYDLLFQYYINVKEGLNISKLGYLHLNRDFTLTPGKESYPDLCDEDVKNLFKLSFEFVTKKGKQDPVKVDILTFFDSEAYAEIKDGVPKHPLIEEIIFELRQIAKGKQLPHKHYECGKAGKCPFICSCFKEALDPNSIFKLTKWGSFGGDWRRTKALLDEGIDKISDIPTEMVNVFVEEKESNGVIHYSNARNQIRFQTEWKDKDFNYVIHENLMNDILHKDYLNDQVEYLIFFDFESIQNPIPLTRDSNPWQQVVTQYSMHILKKGYDLSKHDFALGRGGNCSHYEFIGHPRKDGYKNPEFELFETLRNQLIDFGIDPMAENYRVVVFNKSFEQGRMKEFIGKYVSKVEPDLINFVTHFRNKVIDLLDFFTSGSIYGKEFNGRGSLKVVQPTLCNDKEVNDYYDSIGLNFSLKNSLDYHKEGALVYNGGICLDLYKALLIRSHIDHIDNKPDEDKMLAQALAYCKIDSWGTVIIYDIIKHISDRKIKIKAKFI